VVDLKKFDDDVIVIGTKNSGVTLADKKDQQDTLNTSNGLISNFSHKVYCHKPYVFVCTNKGLSIIRLGTRHKVRSVYNVTSDNFLPSDEVYDALVVKDTLYIATSEGLTVLPMSLFSCAYPPGVYIDNVNVNSRDTVMQPSYVLEHNQDNIGVRFYGISYGGNGKLLYKYRLAGTDDAFTYSTENVVRYNALQPGNYRFVVYAKNHSGAWSVKPAEFSFTILKPYWQTVWFRACMLLTIILSVVVAVDRYIRVIKRRTELHGRVVESELKALRLHMNPHFIFNTLNSLQSFVLKNDPLSANEYISTFSKLIRYIMDASRRDYVMLQDEIDFINMYIHIEQLRLRNKFSFQLELSPELNPYNVHIPSMVIQPFIENAIKYGLAGMDDGKGVLRLSFNSSGNGTLHVRVADNGLGRAAAASNQTGNFTGIQYTNERLKLILKKHSTQDPVQVTDLYDDGKAAGTQVDIKVPVMI
jgi:hypothetical protein